MVKYLVILLDDTSISFCHYNSTRKHHNLINLDILKKAVTYAMKENLMIQYVYPDYELPSTYTDVIDEMSHINIVPVGSNVLAEAIVIDGIDKWKENTFKSGVSYILRIDHNSFLQEWESLSVGLEIIHRLNIVFTDITDFRDQSIIRYTEALEGFSNMIKNLAQRGYFPQINILTDRMLLEKMNNCNAGVENITLAPDGKFYVCPGFYLDNLGSIGSLDEGLNIKNPQLYQLDHSPICSICDSYHCKRCIWLNRKTTLEVNTPSHEQCVVSHIERNASRAFILSLKDGMMANKIPEISYLDPYDELIKRRNE